MTIQFGRHRLTISLTRMTSPRQDWEETIPVGMNDHELARLNCGGAIDLDQARCHALAIMYGGIRRP